MIWAKRAGIAVIAILALFIALIAYVAVFIDPNDFKDRLKSIAAEQANIQLRLDGDISWSFFPWIGIKIEDSGLAFITENDSNKADIVEFESAEFGLNIIPLLSKTISIDTIKLVGLKANLIIDEQGTPNWESKTSTNKTPLPSPTQNSTTQEALSSIETADDATQSTSIPAVHLSLFSIEDAQVHYTDKTSGLLLESKINASIKDVEWGKSWPLEVAIELTQSQANEVVYLQTDLAGDITLSAQEQTVQLANLTINNSVEASFLPISPFVSKLNISTLDLDLVKETLALNALTLSSLGVELTLNANAANIISNPSFDADVKVNDFSPANLLNTLKVDFTPTDSDVLQHMSADLSIKGDSNKASLSHLNMVIDDSSLVADANLFLSPLRWEANINGKNIDIDRYLPPASEEALKDDNTTSGSSSNLNANKDKSEDGLIPVDLIRSLNGTVEINWSNLKAANLQIDHIKFSSTQNKGLVTIKPLSASLYEGEVSLEATLDTRKNTPEISLTPNIQDIQIQPLLVDLADKDQISGVTDLKGNIKTQGNQIDEFIKNSSGNLLVQILEGSLIGTNLTKTVCEGIAKTRDEPLDETLWNDDTPFESMNFPVNIRKGDLSTPGLKIQAAGINLIGDGVVSLPNSSLNYTAGIGLVGSTVDSACRVKEEFKGITFPVICKGNFSDDPASLCRPDLKGFAKQFEVLAKAKLQAKIEAEEARAKKKAQEKLKAEAERLKQRLKKLF